MQVAVYGLWHLGCVTASCTAAAGHQVVGFDLDETVINNLNAGEPPLHEPGLAELIRSELAAQRLSFTTDPVAALQRAEVLWITFDTPVNDRDQADVELVRRQLNALAPHISPGTLILISSQVPVGFTQSLENEWAGRGLRFAYSPENLRLGKALDCFRKPERVVVGIRDNADREQLAALFGPYCNNLEWMSIESAEMTKHALNAFLATSVTFINELARLCEVVGADAKEVERGLKSDIRIGARAYLSPGAAFAGGTLARDVRFLVGHGESHDVETPLFQGVLASNDAHKNWLQHHVGRLLQKANRPNKQSVVTVLGLTYKPGTNTLRRSAAVELCRWLHQQGVKVQAHDPAIAELPDELRSLIDLMTEPAAALCGSDVAVVATEWPQFRTLRADELCEQMRRPCVIDPNHFLSGALGRDSRITYIATGKAA